MRSKAACSRSIPSCLSWRRVAVTPLATAKRRSAGRLAREGLLQGLGFGNGLANPPRPIGAKADDVLDAAIACWTAEQIAYGVVRSIPTTSPIDSRGLRMEMWY